MNRVKFTSKFSWLIGFRPINMQIMSNGIYKAPDHRAMVNRFKERRSITTFCFPSSSVKIGPAKEFTKSGTPPLYRTLTYAGTGTSFTIEGLMFHSLTC